MEATTVVYNGAYAEWKVEEDQYNSDWRIITQSGSTERLCLPPGSWTVYTRNNVEIPCDPYNWLPEGMYECDSVRQWGRDLSTGVNGYVEFNAVDNCDSVSPYLTRRGPG